MYFERFTIAKHGIVSKVCHSDVVDLSGDLAKSVATWFNMASDDGKPVNVIEQTYEDFLASSSCSGGLLKFR